jgi:hypothetical protein
MHIVCEGMWILQGNAGDCPDFHAILTVLGCPGAKRRSLSLHAMGRSGYDCVHHVGSHVAITHRATNTAYRLSCTTYRETDFVELAPCKAALPAEAYSEISAIDLAKTVKGPALFHLLHLCLGCLGIDVLKGMISQRSVFNISHSILPSPLPAVVDAPFLACLTRTEGDGLSSDTAVVVGEDNETARQICHAGKVTHNVRHVVIQTAALPNDIASLK